MPRTPHYLTLSQAAKQTGKSKSVISKALKDGTLSHVEKDDSGYKIDPAELFRVYPKQETANENERTTERSRTPANTHKNDVKNALNNMVEVKALTTTVDLLHERLRDKDERISELKDERDRWHDTATRLMLTYTPAATEMPAEAQKPPAGRGGAADAQTPPRWHSLVVYTLVFMLGLVGIVTAQLFDGEIKQLFGQATNENKNLPAAVISDRNGVTVKRENPLKERREMPFTNGRANENEPLVVQP